MSKTKAPKLEGFAGELRDFALAFPEATEDFPWGERAFKVRGKAFVFLGFDDGALSFSVKLPRTGVQALALPFASPTHYGLGKHGWVNDSAAEADHADVEQQVFDWVRESYVAVAPAKLRKRSRSLAALVMTAGGRNLVMTAGTAEPRDHGPGTP